MAHLIFQAKKWFNIDDNAMKATVGMREFYAFPSKLTVNAGTEYHTPVPDGDHIGEYPGDVAYDTEVDCVGVAEDGYYIVGTLPLTQPESPESAPTISFNHDRPGFVSKSNCKNLKWGG